MGFSSRLVLFTRSEGRVGNTSQGLSSPASSSHLARSNDLHFSL
jgi:hypothetical protein